jgi:hypothetical protein
MADGSQEQGKGQMSKGKSAVQSPDGPALPAVGSLRRQADDQITRLRCSGVSAGNSRGKKQQGDRWPLVAKC